MRTDGAVRKSLIQEGRARFQPEGVVSRSVAVPLNHAGERVARIGKNKAPADAFVDRLDAGRFVF